MQACASALQSAAAALVNVPGLVRTGRPHTSAMSKCSIKKQRKTITSVTPKLALIVTIVPELSRSMRVQNTGEAMFVPLLLRRVGDQI